eukprot:TRINITY_DN2628_c1_g1_i1.p1 TRINITY_DN2628_c1_g1~~TRINITY_DN2628_c1_g1_i1.p1  ORF type:complete len:1082 (+),score=226.59 TRINITY_DN2628_c1_g1_i1:42-3287(+)
MFQFPFQWNPNVAAEPRQERIDIFRAKVDWVVDEYEKQKGKQKGNTHCNRRKVQESKAQLGALKPIRIDDLRLGVVHRGRVLYCTTVVKCGLWQAVSVLVEDSDQNLVSLAVYNVPAVKDVFEAQEWLPEGTKLSIIEPFFKTRADGTPGIRVDNPDDIVFGALPQSTCNYTDGQSSASNQAVLKVGCRVRIRGLKTGAGRRLNGMEGTIKVGYDEQSGRFGVDLDSAGLKSIKPESMINLSSSPSDEATAVPVELPYSLLLAPKTRVEIIGLSADASKTLNGQSGTVEGHDLTKERIIVEVSNAGLKSLRPENLKVLQSSRVALPRPQGKMTSVQELFRQGRFVDSVILRHCCDMAFISHNMDSSLLSALERDAELQRSDAAAAKIITAMVQAAHKKQKSVPTVPHLFDEPTSLLRMCDEALECAKPEQMMALLYLHGTLWRSIGDYSAAAADFRAAYVASGGFCPWILLRAGWTSASANDGLPESQVIQNDAEAQLFYEVLNQYLEEHLELHQSKEVLRNLYSLRVFCCWELAQVMIWRKNRPMLFAMLKGEMPRPPKMDTEFLDCVFCLKDDALKAEQHTNGIMNCIAREAVLDHCSTFQGNLAEPAKSTLSGVAMSDVFSQAAAANSDEADVKQKKKRKKKQQKKNSTDDSTRSQVAAANSDESDMKTQQKNIDDAMSSYISMFCEAVDVQTSTDSEEDEEDVAAESKNEPVPVAANLGAYLKMESVELQRMRDSEKARKAGDYLKSLMLMSEMQMHSSIVHERSFAERRKAIEAQAERLAAQEEAFKKREEQWQEQIKEMRSKAEHLQGKDEDLEDFLEKEIQRQKADFQAEIDQLKHQHQGDLRKAQQHHDEQLRVLSEKSANLGAELRKAMGIKEAEAAKWQRELRDREAQVSLERQSLALKQEQIAQLQAEAEESRRLLEKQEQDLKQQREVQEQILSSSPSAELLGQQRSGPAKVPLNQLRYSQDSHSATFRDGRPLEETIAQLKDGSLAAKGLPQLRIVEMLGSKFSLDNRRLRCLKEALTPDTEIDVEVLSLTDRSVHEELRRKFTAGETITQRERGKTQKGRGKGRRKG